MKRQNWHRKKGFPQELYNCYGDDGNIHTVAYFMDSFPDANSYFQATQSILQKWLREVHNIEVLISILPKIMRKRMNKEKYCGYILNEDWNPAVPSNGTFCKTYEEALEAGLQEALNLIP